MIPEQTLLGFPLFGDNATKVEPDNNKKSNGWQQGDVVPAEWMNWEWYHASKGVADLNKGVSSMEKEIIAVLTEYGIVPVEATEDQLKSVLLKMRPQICECLTAASTAAKSVSLSGNVLKAGNIYVITMTNGNTAANPTLSFNSGTAYPMCNADGVALGSGAWKAGDTITVLFTGAKYLMATIAVTEKIENGNTSPVTSNAVSCVISDDPNPTVLTGPELGVGANFKVLFKAAISASDTTTPLSLTYNGTAYTVKARKDGALVNVLGHETATNIYKYLQAYTAIEFVFDGTNLIIMGNPVLLSDTDYTIYSNGKIGDGNVGDIKPIPYSDIPYGWLLCDGSQYEISDYQNLYNKIGALYNLSTDMDNTKFRVPDYRECALTGVGQNDKDSIVTHDVYTLGEFKDDQFQGHVHSYRNPKEGPGSVAGYAGQDGDFLNTSAPLSDGAHGAPRYGTTTRGKRKGVNWIIKY